MAVKKSNSYFNKDRILMVAEFLENLKIPDHKFNLQNWVGGYRDYHDDEVILNYLHKYSEQISEQYVKDNKKVSLKIQNILGGCPSKEIKCKTVACAMGWCALNNEFNELGLYIYNEILVYIDEDGYTWEDFKAISHFFGIAKKDYLNSSAHQIIDDIFLPIGYEHIKERVTPIHVAQRLRELLEIGFVGVDKKYYSID